ncbi:toxin glutamine deamidase domain-containing protein [Cryptosporangium aurantiacum]|uniref:Papain fold toxin 1, glutamine deamidase n=1 Tax=Cryptosporangium aurantiacum TaxID=134849 RepID=A0A1M7NHJ3_9ACTN|nr:toxin glutamine deamidase domain-containing protein [Cryptosporangium aurantiacum]SHN03191.1 Papain fold toxin 1, glutamine deamidase [Cryptosporangium aurantiacum]
MESSGLALHGLPEPSRTARGGSVDEATETALPVPVDEETDDVQRMGPPEADPDATRWAAGPALPASASEPSLPDGPASPTAVPHALLRSPQLELVRGERDARPQRSRWTRSDFRLAADPDVEAGPPALHNTPALPDPSDRMNADRRRRFVDEPTQPYQMPDPADFEPGPTPPELLTPPEFVSAPVETASDDVQQVPLAQAFSVDVDETPAPVSPAPTVTPETTQEPAEPDTQLMPLPVAEQRPDVLLPLVDVGIEPVERDPSGPFGGARDYRQAVADRLPRAIRLLMPPPVAPPDALPRTQAIESGRRRSDVELQVQAHRSGREAQVAEARTAELSRQAAIARDQAYEARATWQWTAHRRTTLADELQQITTEANTVADEQRRLSEQARGAMRDVAAWDAWIGQLREEGARLAAEGQSADAEAALARAEQGQAQAGQLRDWLDRAEQRFRQLGAHLDGLAGERDKRVNESVELAARQQLLVDRYQRLGSEAQQMDREAAAAGAEAIGLRLECRERLIDLVGLRPELCRWVNGAAVALVREGGRHGVGRYEIPVGYRRPLQSEHVALEQVLPRTEDGAFEAAPEPTSDWLARLNGVGPYADNSRAQNCVDATLAFFDAYVRGRPRVAVPRIVDAHRSGTTRLPLRGEPTGRRRLEDALGGNLQLLFRQAEQVQSRFETYQVHAAFDTVTDQLRKAGHGAFAVLVSGWQDGDARTTAVVNHRGAVRWVDPQLGVVSDAPVPVEWVRTLETVIVDGKGRPVPLPGMPLSPWTTRTASTAYATAVTEPAPANLPPPTAAGPPPAAPVSPAPVSPAGAAASPVGEPIAREAALPPEAAPTPAVPASSPTAAAPGGPAGAPGSPGTPATGAAPVSPAVGSASAAPVSRAAIPAATAPGSISAAPGSSPVAQGGSPAGTVS